MNHTKLVLVALALCLCFVLPVAAVWSNGNWVPEDALNGYTVDYNPQSGVTSKLKPIDIGAELKESPQSYFGVLKFNLRCGYSTLTREVGIRNDAVTDGEFTFYPIHPDGSFETELVPGNFTILLKDSNGGQPQTSHATIVAGQVSYPFNEMLGHAVSGNIGIYPLKVITWIDGCDVNLNGLKLVKDELITVPESEKTVCQRVKIIDQPYVPAVPGTQEQGHWITVIDSPAVPAWVEQIPAVTHTVHHNAVPAVPAHCSKSQYNNEHQCDDHQGTWYNTVPATSAWDEVIVDKPATHIHHAATPAVTHQEWVVDVPAVPAVPAIQERSHYETQCHQVVVPSYQYWTYKLEGRLTVKSIDTLITNPNLLPLTGHVTVNVKYTVDHNFGKLFNTTPVLEDMTKTFTGTFASVPKGNNFFDGDIAFSERINDAIIDEDHFPYVDSSSIVTDVPLGYYLIQS